VRYITLTPDNMQTCTNLL